MHIITCVYFPYTKTGLRRTIHLKTEAFLTVLVIYHGLTSVVARKVPEWSPGASISFEHDSLISDFEMTAKHYLSRDQVSSRWDINGGISKLYLSYKDPNTSGMYYYFPVTSATGNNETACYFYPSLPDKATADIPASVFPNLNAFTFNGEVTVNGIKVENWTNGYGTSMYDAYNNIYVHYREYSRKMEAVLFQSEYKFVMSSWNVPGSRVWAHTKKIFYGYQPCEPDPGTWKHPQDVKCRIVDADVGEYMIYLLATYMGLPEDSSFNNLFVNETYYLGDTKMIPIRSFHGMPVHRNYESKSIQVSLYPEEDVHNYGDKLPKSWDWRKQGAVTGAKNQGICLGGSWAFGVVGAIEGAYFLKTKKMVTLSEQALIDCSWQYGNSGCFRGSSKSALEWIVHNGGLPIFKEYGRFQEGHGYCLANKFKPVAPVKGFVHVSSTTDAVKSALVKHGPLVARIFAPYDFRYYTSADGVYKSAMEGTEQYVVLIGYGSFNDEPYWLIKNSWSSYWGMDGFAMISSEDNMLNILDSVYYVEM